MQRLYMRFLEGETTIEEEKTLYEALTNNPALKEEMEALDDLRSQFYNPSADRVRSFRAVRRRINKGRILWGSVAAACVAACFLLLFHISGNDKEASPSPDIIRLCTARGEIRTETLPDGSTVRLNSSSTISYADNFVSKRELKLSGEAYFVVTADPEHPFSVHVGESTVTAKGTKFNVSAYHSDPEIKTVLVEGKVEFSNSSMSLTMRPGEVLSYGTVTGNVSTWSENVNQYLSWMNGHLNYDRISLERLLVRLSSIYDMDIRYSPVKYADSSFRISLNTREPIENVLQAVATITPISWKIDGNIISIKEK